MNSITRRTSIAGRTLRVPALAIAATLALLAGCGGGGDDAALAVADQTASLRTATAQAQAQAVEVTGCVVDKFFIPRTGTPVRALSADGRLLGHATSDRMGHFNFKVAAQRAVTLQIERDGAESMSAPADRADLPMGHCLQDLHDE